MGMKIATKTNVRTTQAARQFTTGIESFFGGGTMGLGCRISGTWINRFLFFFIFL
jgi:Na+/H+-translocating membrane pyrophosphatase